jgi:hypothetical protein
MATDFCVRIGKRIRVLRTERGWTQTKLVDHAETTREPENGHKSLTSGFRARLSGHSG